MGLGWAGFLSGMGQGLQRAAGSVDEYTNAKRLAQQLAMQQAQQAHLVAQDALAQKNFLAREASDKEKENRQKDLQDRQIINEDLMNMNQDQIPLASMPAAYQANARKYAPSQIAYTPPSMGKSTDMGEVGPSDGGEMLNRFVSPAERNNMRSMETALARANATNDRLYSTQGDRTAEMYYAADRAAQSREATAKAAADRAELSRKTRAGQFGFSQANTGLPAFIKQWGADPANQYSLDDVQGKPALALNVGKPKPMPPDILQQKKLELFQNAIGASGYGPADFPEILNKLGVQSGQEPPAPATPPPTPPPPAAPGLKAVNNVTPPAQPLKAPAAPGTVRLIAPDQSEMDVPKELVASYVAKGAKVKDQPQQGGGMMDWLNKNVFSMNREQDNNNMVRPRSY